MATRTVARRSPSKSRSTSASKKKASGRGRSASPGTRKPASPARPSAWERSRDAAGRQLRGHGQDAAAVLLLVVGVLTALGLAGDAAGGVGRGLGSAAGALFGLARYVVPAVCIGLAVLCFWWRPGDVSLAAAEADEVDGVRDAVVTAAEPAPLRVAAGLILLGIAALGMLHLAAGGPALDGPLDELRDAAGLTGAVIGAPLASIAGTAGAAVIFAGLALLGALLAPGVPMRTVLAGAGGGVRFLGRQARAFTELKPVDGAVVDEPAPFHDDPYGHDLIEPVDDTDSIELVERVEAYDDPTEVADDDPPPAPSVTLYDVEADVPVDVPVVDAGPGAQMAIDLGPAHRTGTWKLPPTNLLKRGDGKGVERRFVEEGGKVLEATLHQHGVDAQLVGMTIGPTVTRYELELAPGVKVNRITSLSHDIAYAMASPDVRILAPIPGRSAIGVEVPNRQRQLVTLGDILVSQEARDASHPLEVGLGRDIAGRAHMLNLATLPHVLIAGATGAGKSSCINSLVTSLLMRNTPDQVRLILVDPKRVELGAYNDLPHLLTPVVTNPKKAANALDWAVREMDLRYEILAEVGVRDITGYNAAFDRGELPTPDDPDPITGKGYERLPFIVIVVDELNDLMMVAARDVEASICRIAQMARAVGIHLVIATQRPSVDVITGVIKANVPSRLAFSVTSLADSRVILDQAGAEKLVGKGDLLMVTASSSRPQRIQGAWVDEECVRKVAAHWKRQANGASTYVSGVADDGPGGSGSSGADADDDGDELLGEAMSLVVRSGLGSTSMLQRKLRVGFARAGRLMDLLERKGVVGPSEGSKARTVLMTVEELEAMEARGAEPD
jgi:S-DNA-T family DNA segregation ATPase FtsK/SpoIIIE